MRDSNQSSIRFLSSDRVYSHHSPHPKKQDQRGLQRGATLDVQRAATAEPAARRMHLWSGSEAPHSAHRHGMMMISSLVRMRACWTGAPLFPSNRPVHGHVTVSCCTLPALPSARAVGGGERAVPGPTSGRLACRGPLRRRLASHDAAEWAPLRATAASQSGERRHPHACPPRRLWALPGGRRQRTPQATRCGRARGRRRSSTPGRRPGTMWARHA